MRDAREDTIEGLEALANIAAASAPVLAATGAAAPTAPAAALAGILLHSVANQMRNHGKTPEEILQAIEMPRKLDVDDSRSDIDRRIADLPEKP